MRYNIVTYMRILAWFLVIRGHYYSLFELPKILGKGIITGAGPVVLFFVVSGFLAYISIEKEGNSLKAYYGNRAKRIIPPYYIVLILCIVFSIVMNKPVGDTSYIGWLRYFLFINMLVPSCDFSSWNNLYGFWTMGCFPIFYLIAPFLYKRMKKIKDVIVILSGSFLLMFVFKIIVEIVLSRTGHFDGISALATLNPFSTLYLFILGMVAAYAYRSGCVAEIAMVFGVLLIGMLALGRSGYVLWGLASACVLLKPSIPIAIEKNKVYYSIVNFLDKNSFNMYLLHLLVYDVWIKITQSNGVLGCICCVTITMILSEGLSKVTKGMMKILKEK